MPVTFSSKCLNTNSVCSFSLYDHKDRNCWAVLRYLVFISPIRPKHVVSVLEDMHSHNILSIMTSCVSSKEQTTI